jgi:hypothetical protein
MLGVGATGAISHMRRLTVERWEEKDGDHVDEIGHNISLRYHAVPYMPSVI